MDMRHVMEPYTALHLKVSLISMVVGTSVHGCYFGQMFSEIEVTKFSRVWS